MYVIGCDPGKTGAIVGVGLTSLVILRTPHMKSAKGRGEEILYAQMWNEFGRLFMLPDNSGPIPDHAFIERVQAMPQQGGSSMFKFGYSAGFLRGLVQAARIPLDMVEPLTWKAAAGIPPKADKEASITRACQLWPNETYQFTPQRGKWTKEECIGVADAALIARHGLAMLTGSNDTSKPKRKAAKTVRQHTDDELRINEFDI